MASDMLPSLERGGETTGRGRLQDKRKAASRLLFQQIVHKCGNGEAGARSVVYNPRQCRTRQSSPAGPPFFLPSFSHAACAAAFVSEATPCELSVNRLNPRQLEAVKYISSPLLVLAGAGSGKTSDTSERICTSAFPDT